MNRRQLLKFNKDLVKAGELLAQAHKANVQLAMLISDMSLGKVYSDGVLDSYIKVMAEKKQTSMQFEYTTLENIGYKVTLYKRKKPVKWGK